MIKKLLLVLTTFAAFALVACGGAGPAGPAAQPTQEAIGDDDLAPELSVYNWADYIDEELIIAYQEEYGVTIIYDTYASNEDLLAKLEAGAAGYDVIFPSDYMVDIMIDLELLAEINKDALPNIANMDPAFMDAPFDPGNKYCVPYQWGTTGLGYRAGDAFFEENEPNSWAILFEPEWLEQYSGGGINVLNDPRELGAAAALYLGIDPNTEDQADIDQILELLLAAKPYWKTFNSEDYPTSLLIPDEVVLTHGWSGGVAQAYYETWDDELEDGNWYYSIPEEGAVKWLDNICMTAASERKGTAQHFINYLLDAENGAAITNFVYYGSPNKAAEEYILPEILDDPSIYPPAEVQEKLVWLTAAGSDEGNRMWDDLWTAVKAGN